MPTCTQYVLTVALGKLVMPHCNRMRTTDLKHCSPSNIHLQPRQPCAHLGSAARECRRVVLCRQNT